MPDVKISAGADPVTLVATDKVPMARSASTTAYAATMAELATYANGAYVPNYYAGTPSMDGTGAAGTAAFVSRGDHIHPTDTSRAPLASPTFTGTPAAPTPTTGDSTTRIATSAFVQAAVAPDRNNVGRNLLHNPLFNVAQRGVGPFTTNSYTADRWLSTFLVAGQTVSISVAAITDGSRGQIGDEAATWALSNNFTGSAAVGSYIIIQQAIEDVRRLAGKTATISFWAAANSGTPKLGVSFDQRFGTGGSPSAAVQMNGQAITLSTVWARYSLTFTFPSIAGKTFGTNNDHSTILDIWCSAEVTTFGARSGNIGVQSAMIFLWGIQLEIGTAATPLEKPDPRYDLANCQRFFQAGYFQMTAYQGAGTGFNGTAALPVQMRASPTVAFSGTSLVNLPSIAIVAGPFSGFLVIGGTATASGATSIVTFYTATADL